MSRIPLCVTSGGTCNLISVKLELVLNSLSSHEFLKHLFLLFRNGRCWNGDGCNYMHVLDFSKMQDCTFFLKDGNSMNEVGTSKLQYFQVSVGMERIVVLCTHALKIKSKIVHGSLYFSRINQSYINLFNLIRISNSALWFQVQSGLLQRRPGLP